ncbi:hypothetical protein J2W27_004833 [Variovorax boronicumulans]|nr:hypothetical protein [Variovorax boronicumulans]
MLNEHSSEASHAAIAATSSTSTKRPIGTRESRAVRSCSRCSAGTPAKTAVSAADGVMQFTSTPDDASSLPSDLVSAMSPAFEAE